MQFLRTFLFRTQVVKYMQDDTGNPQRKDREVMRTKDTR